eukprot:12407119-Karenia_brevis.AAC.1
MGKTWTPWTTWVTWRISLRAWITLTWADWAPGRVTITRPLPPRGTHAWSSALAARGWEVIHLEIKDGADQDILEADVYSEMLRLVERRLVSAIHSGIDCSAKSIARHPALCSPEHPLGKPDLRGLQAMRASQSNEFLRRTLNIFAAAQPASSSAVSWSALAQDPAEWGEACWRHHRSILHWQGLRGRRSKEWSEGRAQLRGALGLPAGSNEEPAAETEGLPAG